jgi:pimeloyl-ACP methyl ester carboxylesterase
MAGREEEVMKHRTILGAGLLLAVICIMLALALVWAPDRSVESLAARWAPPPSEFLAIDGMQAHLRDEGRRDDEAPLLLLHGTSASLHTWDGWVERLAGRRRVIRVDLPGFGLTGPHPAGTYDIDAYTGFVIALMDRMQLRRVVLVGNSLGGYIAWKTAHDHPERVAKLILIDSAGYAYQSESVPLGFRLARSPLLSPVFAHVLTRGTVASSLRNVYGDPTRVSESLVDRYYELTLRAGNRRAVAARFRQLKGGEHVSALARISQPTLIIWGAKDRLIPLEFGRRFERELPHATLVVFDELGHVPQEEDPSATVETAMGFLSGDFRTWPGNGAMPGEPARE